ncbi:unnamed protein product, partial [Protopolystoma xenopodis]
QPVEGNSCIRPGWHVRVVATVCALSNAEYAFDDNRNVRSLIFHSSPQRDDKSRILNNANTGSLESRNANSSVGRDLVEVMNISDKFPEKTKREMEMELISKILTHQEPTHKNRYAVILKTLEKNEQ